LGTGRPRRPRWPCRARRSRCTCRARFAFFTRLSGLTGIALWAFASRHANGKRDCNCNTFNVHAHTVGFFKTPHRRLSVLGRRDKRQGGQLLGEEPRGFHAHPLLEMPGSLRPRKELRKLASRLVGAREHFDQLTPHGAGTHEFAVAFRELRKWATNPRIALPDRLLQSGSRLHNALQP
jgi:hypothetical protein